MIASRDEAWKDGLRNLCLPVYRIADIWLRADGVDIASFYKINGGKGFRCDC